MKKWLYILAAILLQIQFVSCMDEQLVGDSSANGMTSLKMVFDIPVENAKTRGLGYGPDQEATEQESVISDIYAIAFDKDGKCVDKFYTTYESGILTATVNLDRTASGEEITVMVLTNLENLENGEALVGSLDNMIGKSKEEVLKALVYNFSGAWDVAKRQLPMWGETQITPLKGKSVEGSVRLYRAVAKINVTVNKGEGIKDEDGTDIFKLHSVRVYYARTSGLVGSLHAPVANTPDETIGSPTIIEPSMPDGVGYMPRYKTGNETNGIYFEADNDYIFENRIYIPEAYQPGEQPTCLVVGGSYQGGEDTYYRIDFKPENKGKDYYHALRNHVYNFDIKSVGRQGTDTPDPALDHVVAGMDVTVTPWTMVYMRGIGGQYTLEVEASGVILDASNESESNNSLWVKTTYNGGWEIEPNSQEGNWYTVKKVDGKVIIVPNINKGGQRRGSFVITSGNLRKVIMVRQKGEGTANCYVVSDNGDIQDLVVTVKGNGEDGLIADSKPLVDQKPYISPAYAKVIWETAEGLVTLQGADNTGKTMVNEDGIVKYQINLEPKDPESNIKDGEGGNALIGAFDESDELLWSWHLWVCPDMDTNGDGIVGADELEKHLQKWSTGYQFLDRNLGALSNKPGLTSLGLLYQWGRKDPFIGAGEITENAKRMYTWNLEEGGKLNFPWNSDAGVLSVEAARKAPTTLSTGALTSEDNDYPLLWGTDQGFKTNGERDAGNKTIYDPCPVGYRVPPVGSVVFESEEGDKNSSNMNWDSNNIYWPNLETLGKEENNYKSGADSYGFWLNRANGYEKPTGVPFYSDGSKNAESVAGATWLPIAGVYDGNMENFALVDGQWSVTVNSIMWTNSSIKAYNETRPGALFLHGTEDWNNGLSHNNEGSGRHIHQLIESGKTHLYAAPSHAGSVRCIKDEKSTVKNSIKTPASITLKARKGSTATETLVSITESWEVVNPGASWFVMTPDEGGTGSTQKITFTATETNTGAKREATLKIRFSDNKTEKEIQVIKESIPPTAAEHNLTFAGYKGEKEGPSIQSVGINSNNWYAESNCDWLQVSINNISYSNRTLTSGGGRLFIKLAPNISENDKAKVRTATITIRDEWSSIRTETITVTQGIDEEK